MSSIDKIEKIIKEINPYIKITKFDEINSATNLIVDRPKQFDKLMQTNDNIFKIIRFTIDLPKSNKNQKYKKIKINKNIVLTLALAFYLEDIFKNKIFYLPKAEGAQIIDDNYNVVSFEDDDKLKERFINSINKNLIDNYKLSDLVSNFRTIDNVNELHDLLKNIYDSKTKVFNEKVPVKIDDEKNGIYLSIKDTPFFIRIEKVDDLNTLIGMIGLVTKGKDNNIYPINLIYLDRNTSTDIKKLERLAISLKKIQQNENSNELSKLYGIDRDNLAGSLLDLQIRDVKLSSDEDTILLEALKTDNISGVIFKDTLYLKNFKHDEGSLNSKHYVTYKLKNVFEQNPIFLKSILDILKLKYRNTVIKLFSKNMLKVIKC